MVHEGVIELAHEQPEVALLAAALVGVAIGAGAAYYLLRKKKESRPAK